ncbi:putative nuclease HARBI1 [Ischnura elegans]|uniref:putative nuclease HARBI1 n=1 Tax=Ischnura elegans TaxID=197161 RepID=UPI001ED8BA65|nr:putative nuclease HARBI1 [Ischnura elegans]
MDNLEAFVRRLERLANQHPRLEKRYVRDAQNPFDFFRDREFLQRYRFPKEAVRGPLLEMVRPHFVRNSERGLPIPPVMKLLTALRFYATSSYQVVCGDLHGISQPSVSLIVKDVSRIFARRLPEYVKVPSTAEEVAQNALQFYEVAGFPGVLGAIDGTHIMIKNPGGAHAEVYRNRKGYFSINVQVIVNSKLVIMDLVVRRPGSCHDARVFDNSSIRARLEGGQVSGILIGDSGYPCREYLFTPILRPGSRAEERYNRSHIKTRNAVERAIGVWKRRFPCLKRGLGTL